MAEAQNSLYISEEPFNGVVYAYDPVFVSNGEDFRVTEVRVRLTTPNP